MRSRSTAPPRRRRRTTSCSPEPLSCAPRSSALRRAPKRLALALGVLLAGLSGCAAPQFANVPLAPDAANREGRDVVMTSSRPIILMSFSGGGSRAAALAFAVLKEIRQYDYVDGTGTK